MHTRHESLFASRSFAAMLALVAGGAIAISSFTCTAATLHAQPGTNPGDADTLITPSPAINVAWKAWREALDARSAFLDPREVAATADRYREWLIALNTRVPAMVDAKPGEAEWAAALMAEGRALREASLRRILLRISPQAPMLDDPAVEADIDSVRRDLASWKNRAALLTEDLRTIEASLAQARTLDEGGPSSIRSLVEKWTREGLIRQPGVRAAISPVLDGVEVIEKIDRETSSDELLRLARQSPPNQPAILFAAWRRLGSRGQTLWPSTEHDLAAEVSLRPLLTRDAKLIADPERAEQLADEVSMEQARRLTRVLGTAVDDATLAAADKAIHDLGLSELGLDGRVRYNLMLNRLKRAVTVPGITDADTRNLARQFATDVRNLHGGIAFLSGANSVVAALDAVAGGLELSPATVEPGRFGPAAAGLGAGVENAATLTFSLQPKSGAPAATLEFVLVGEGLAASYITVQEVSVGQVSAIIAAKNAEQLITEVLPLFRQLEDSRPGPRTWTWSRDDFGESRVVPAPNWLSQTAVLGGVDYPQNLHPAPPTFDSPMQHVPAAAAAYIASLAGCRLPTTGEWASLLKEQASEVRRELANLRDSRWQRFDEHMRARENEGKWFQPADSGVFFPAGATINATEAYPWDDGWLWIAPTSSGKNDIVSHVLGNVAEYVTTLPWDLPPSPATAAKKAAAGLAELRVVGGSALSSPSIDPQTPQELDPIDALEGFADVGFRLAFGADRANVVGARVGSQVLEILTPTPYLKQR